MNRSDITDEKQKRWQNEQNELKQRLICDDTEEWQKKGVPFEGLHYIGGVDISFVKTSTTQACASLVICRYPDMEVVYEDCDMVELTAPYISGFLAFREVGFFLKLLDRLRQSQSHYIPQVIMVDGNGILHPRGFGTASHLGVLADIPCIGVAKKLMQIDGLEKNDQHASKIAELIKAGDSFPLIGDSGKIWGKAVRSCDKSSNPIYVSVGHRIHLETAVGLTYQCSLYRIPEPIRQADIRSREFLRLNVPATEEDTKKIRKSKSSILNTMISSVRKSFLMKGVLLVVIYMIIVAIYNCLRS
ncbi:endonuclease V-like [Amphiura filiformis]|uniref:endonuclease V-like n=1 Tax=Amphiura filiformis TaxID=82378 RepID=UPI003B220B16